MRYIIDLEKEDIIKIIAEKFDVDEEKVSLTVRSECRGWGTDEHYENVIYGTVRKETL